VTEPVDPSAGTFDDAGDDRSPTARLRRAELRIAHLEGQIEQLREQVAALEAADEHRRVELADAHAESAEARADAREAQARAEERRQLIEELRTQLAELRQDGADRSPGGADTRTMGWRARRRANRSP
jgi:chromosome segregation ATPase